MSSITYEGMETVANQYYDFLLGPNRNLDSLSTVLATSFKIQSAVSEGVKNPPLMVARRRSWKN